VETTSVLVLTLKRDWDYPPHFIKAQGHFAGRRRELARLTDSLERRNSGSILVSGNRGVGKTALVFKALQELRSRNENVVAVVINVSELDIDVGQASKTLEKFPTLEMRMKIIQNLIRRLFTGVGSARIGQSGLDKLYKKAVASQASEIEILAAETGTETKSAATVAHQFAVPTRALIVTIATMASLVLAYDSPLLPQGFLAKIGPALPVLVAIIGPFALLFSWRKVQQRREFRRRKLSASEFYEFDANLGNLQFDLETVLDNLLERKLKVIFCIDELDKTENARLVVEIIKSFKNLFNLSSAVFVLITDKTVFDEIENARATRSTDYTLFTHRIFIPRPSFADLEEFFDEVIESPALGKVKRDRRYRDFRNYLCYLSKSDFFDLYNIIGDFVSGFDSEHRPQVRVPDLDEKAVGTSRLQKAMGQIIAQYERTKISEWEHNEALLSSLYQFVEALNSMPANTNFTDDFADVNVQEFKEARRDLCTYLTRLQTINPVSKSPEGVTTYQWIGRVNEVPSQLQYLLEYEERFVKAVDGFKEAIVEYASAYQTGIGGNLFDFGRPGALLDVVPRAVEADFRGVLDQANRFYSGLRRPVPAHYRLEELEQQTQQVETQKALLLSRVMVLVRNIAKDTFAKAEASSLQQNEKLFSVIQDLRNAIVAGNIEHSVVHKSDLSKQLLFTHNVPADIIERSSKLLRQNRSTFFVLNVQTEPKLLYEKAKGFKTIMMPAQLKEVPALISSLRKWFES